MKIKKRLGEMLIDEGLISHERLTQALEEQKKAGLKLGQYLTRMGIVSEGQNIDLMRRQLKISRYHPDEYPLEIALADHFTIEVAQKHQISP